MELISTHENFYFVFVSPLDSSIESAFHCRATCLTHAITFYHQFLHSIGIYDFISDTEIYIEFDSSYKYFYLCLLDSIIAC